MTSLKSYINDLMSDKRNDPVSQCLKLCLLVVSFGYGFLAGIHRALYDFNILKSYKAPLLVISVGNISLGGTGKTPFVIMLAKRLAEKAGTKPPAVLIRGYGEDEWKLLEDKLSKDNVRIFVGRDRIANAKKALASGAKFAILDDGFQHRRLKRDLDIVLIDSANPFGNGFLFPRGTLREPVSSLARADVVVLTKADKEGVNPRFAERKIRETAAGKIFLKAVHKPKALRDVFSGRREEMSFVKGKTVCLFSAICDHSYFRHTVEKSVSAYIGLEFVFPDHHIYAESDLIKIFDGCREKRIETVITTEKDAVKLKNLKSPEVKPKVFALEIELEIVGGQKELDDEIAGLYKRGLRDNI